MRPEGLGSARDGVVGEGGKEAEESVGEARLQALFEGRNIPAPGIDVVKYRVLLRPVSTCHMSIWL